MKEDVNGKLFPRKSLNPDNPTILALTGVILGFAKFRRQRHHGQQRAWRLDGLVHERGPSYSFDVLTGSVGGPVASADVQV